MKRPSAGAPVHEDPWPAGQTRLTESPTISSSVSSSHVPEAGHFWSALTRVCACVARVRGSGVRPRLRSCFHLR